MRIQIGLCINIRCESMKLLKNVISTSVLVLVIIITIFDVVKKKLAKKVNPKTKQKNLEVHQNKKH